METEQNKKTNNPMIKVIIVLFVFFIILISVLLFVDQKNRIERNVDKKFESCDELANSCNDQSCQYYFLCSESENSNCNVYDCGIEYGIEITELDGSIIAKTRQILDQEKINKIVDSCSGEVQVLEKKSCEDGKAVVTVRVLTKGDCEVDSFTMKINDRNRITSFQKIGENYVVSVRQCGEISEVVAIGDDGNRINDYLESGEIELR